MAASHSTDARVSAFIRALNVVPVADTPDNLASVEIVCTTHHWRIKFRNYELVGLQAASDDELAAVILDWVATAVQEQILCYTDPPTCEHLTLVERDQVMRAFAGSCSKKWYTYDRTGSCVGMRYG